MWGTLGGSSKAGKLVVWSVPALVQNVELLRLRKAVDNLFIQEMGRDCHWIQSRIAQCTYD